MSNYIQQLHSYSISHKDATVDIRENFSITQDQAELIYEKKTAFHIDELFILSTCNRTEFYAICEDRDALIKLISKVYKKLQKDIEFSQLVHRSGERCILHLMKVSAGMNSMMLGETQITAQIKASFAHARQHSATGPILNRFIQSALEAGKRVRTETELSTGAISVSYAAVEKIKSIIPNLTHTKILLIGAGTTGKLTASNFIKKGASNFLIANRRPERGKKLAEETNGTYIPFDDIAKVLPNVDIIVTCTGANFPVLTFDQVEKLGEFKKQLILMDLSVPRNIQPNIGTIKNVTLFTVDELETAVSESLISRQQELPRASIIINEVTNEFLKWIKHLSVTPTIADLKHLFEDIQDSELSKIKTKYDDETLDAINIFSKSLLRKILKDPISTLKTQASNGHYTPSMVDTLRSIYQLDKPKAVEQD
jgi:glutamyl-tRNA reductase